MATNFWLLMAGCVVVTYGSRLIGLYLPTDRLTMRQQALLGYVPIGAFMAIVFQGLTEAHGELDARIPAILLAGILAAMRRPLWMCLALGLGLYVLLNRVLI